MARIQVIVKLTEQQWEQLYELAQPNDCVSDVVQGFVDRRLAKLFLEKKAGE